MGDCMNDKPKKTRDAETTKKAILAAAEDLFSEEGYCGTSIAEISKKSGVSGPLIVFHFKNKRGVYKAVKEAIVKRYSECLPEPVKEVETLYGIIRNIMKAMFSYYQNNPTMMRICNWSTLEGRDEPWGGESEWHHIYIDQISKAQEKGEIRKDISPYQILIIVTGAIHVWWEFHDHMLRDVCLLDDPEKANEDYYNSLEAVLLRGLTPATVKAENRG